ncbi:MAG: PrsW family intramembrane metalloprotease [Patescibacteria group bacterium]
MSFLILLAIALATVLPALVWLFFFMREDIHPEPKRIIAYTFGIGVLSALPTLLAQIIFKDAAGHGASMAFIFLGLATIEEIFKFLAAFYAVHGSKYFDEPIDAMIYMIAAASGFATIENVLIALGSIESLTLPALYETGSVLLLRFIGATLLHVLASGIVGYYWGKSIAARHTHRGLLVYGIVIATVVHTVFNYLIAIFGDQNVTYGSLILIVAAFFVLNDFEILKHKPQFSSAPTKTA